MRNSFLLSVLLALTFNSTFAQAPGIQWTKCIGGTYPDYGQDIQPTSDGGYIMIGKAESSDGDASFNWGKYDYWIVKLNSARQITWQKSLGGENDDIPDAVKQTSDGGYIVVGKTRSKSGDVTGTKGGSVDVWIVKLTSSGQVSWKRCYGGTNDEGGTAVIQTSDGGYVFSAYVYSKDGDVVGAHKYTTDMWVVKLDGAGNIGWQKCLGGIGADSGEDIKETSDGGFIVVGASQTIDGDVTTNNGGIDLWVVKLSGDGQLNWQKSFGGSGNENATGVYQTADGGYVVVGESTSNDGDVSGNHGDWDAWVLKLNGSGGLIWQKSLGGSGIERMESVLQTADGGYVLGGFTASEDGNITLNHGRSDAWLVKLNDSGAISWQKTYGGPGDENFMSIYQSSDGGLIAVGCANSQNNGDVSGVHGYYSDLWIVKLSSQAISIASINKQSFCNGDSISVNFNIQGSYNSGNQVKIYLSDATGSFSNEKLLGSVTTSLTGTVKGLIPVSQASGANYLIRIKTTNPEVISPSSGVISINQTPTVTLANFTEKCSNAGLVTLTGGSPAGGSYSGTGVSAGKFDTNSGSQVITYTYSSNGCSSNAKKTFVVNAVPQVSLSNFTPVCSNADSVVLSGGYPNGGTYSGNGVSGGKFSPTVGTQVINYKYTDSKGCSAVVSKSFTVNTAPTVTMDSFDQVCSNVGVITLTGGKPVGGTYSGTNVTNGKFNPSGGTQQIKYTYVDNKQCSNTAKKIFTVKQAPPKPTILFAYPYLYSSSWDDNQWFLNFLPIEGATGYQYQPSGNGKYYVKVTTNQCSDSSDVIEFVSTGINASDMNTQKIQFYPNPSSGIVFIETQFHGMLNVVDVFGKIVFTGSMKNGRNQLDLTAFSKGVYSFIFDSEGTKQSTLRFIKE